MEKFTYVNYGHAPYPLPLVAYALADITNWAAEKPDITHMSTSGGYQTIYTNLTLPEKRQATINRIAIDTYIGEVEGIRYQAFVQIDSSNESEIAQKSRVLMVQTDFPEAPVLYEFSLKPINPIEPDKATSVFLSATVLNALEMPLFIDGEEINPNRVMTESQWNEVLPRIRSYYEDNISTIDNYLDLASREARDITSRLAVIIAERRINSFLKRNIQGLKRRRLE